MPSSRIIYIASYILSIILLAAHSASLISFLAVKTPLKLYDNLVEFSKTNDKLLVTGKTSEFEFFKESTDPIAQKIYQHNLKPVLYDTERSIMDNFETNFRFICDGKEKAIVMTEQNFDLLTNYYPTLQCGVSRFKSPVLRFHFSIVVNEELPYGEFLDYRLLLMREHGIIYRSYKKYFARPQNKIDKPLDSIVFADISELLMLLSLFLAMSVIIFLCEIMYYRRLRINEGSKI